MKKSGVLIKTFNSMKKTLPLSNRKTRNMPKKTKDTGKNKNEAAQSLSDDIIEDFNPFGADWEPDLVFKGKLILKDDRRIRLRS